MVATVFVSSGLDEEVVAEAEIGKMDYCSALKQVSMNQNKHGIMLSYASQFYGSESISTADHKSNGRLSGYLSNTRSICADLKGIYIVHQAS